MAKPTNAVPLLQRYGKPLLLLVLVAVLAYGVLLAIAQLTAARIEHNERAWFEAQIKALVPANLHDNDLLTDRIEVVAPDSLGTRRPLAIYRARLNGTPTAVVINSIAPDGYGGPIELLVAVDYSGTALGVRVLSHHETPGIGNAFEFPDSTWLDAFRGRSLRNPDTAGWNIRKDGGDFDQFTSATISPRAIIKAVQRTLDYYQRNREQLFAAKASS
jgi:electron transport complex protein RnfG